MAVKIIRSKKSIATLNTARDTDTLKQRKASLKKTTKTKAQEARPGRIPKNPIISMTYLRHFVALFLLYFLSILCYNYNR